MSKIDLYQILKHPIRTEKTTNLEQSSNIFAFEVQTNANKSQIRKAVELVFGVKVLSVKTSINPGKNKVFRGKRGRRSDSKRALIKTERGQIIDLEKISF